MHTTSQHLDIQQLFFSILLTAHQIKSPPPEVQQKSSSHNKPRPCDPLNFRQRLLYLPYPCKPHHNIQQLFFSILLTADQIKYPLPQKSSRSLAVITNHYPASSWTLGKGHFTTAPLPRQAISQYQDIQQLFFPILLTAHLIKSHPPPSKV